MFCWCYYAHITRIARSSPLGPVGLEPERGVEGRERERERKRRERKEEEEARKPAKKQLPGKMTGSWGFIQGGEDVGLSMEMEENWSNQVLMCSGLQTSLALLHSRK